jgi:chaperonin GroES
MTATEKKVKLQPLSDRVLAQRVEADETVKGGIILPESARQKQETVTIIAVGPGKKDSEGNLIPMPVSTGDTVLMEKYSGQEVTIDDEEYVIVNADKIIAIVQ